MLALYIKKKSAIKHCEMFRLQTRNNVMMIDSIRWLGCDIDDGVHTAPRMHGAVPISAAGLSSRVGMYYADPFSDIN